MPLLDPWAEIVTLIFLQVRSAGGKNWTLGKLRSGTILTSSIDSHPFFVSITFTRYWPGEVIVICAWFEFEFIFIKSPI